MEHTSISPQQAADRLAIRELIDAYAQCADRRDAEGQKALFAEDTRFVVYMDGVGTAPTEDLHGREQLTPVFAALKQYEVTMHFNGQSTLTLEGDQASGETYCIAHHVFSADGERKIMLAYLRYADKLAKQDGVWLFAERNLYLEFSDTRSLGRG
jgi:ketosteroid isomerase-like protein